jgi:hypothetical protein
MKITDVPEQYKFYVFKLSNGKEFVVSGLTKKNILESKSNFIELEIGSGFNKSFIVNWEIEMEKTREEVLKNKDKILNDFNDKK